MKIDELPYDVIYYIPQFLETCDDVSNFRLTCRLFSGVRLVCNHSNIHDPLRIWWMKFLFGERIGRTLLHNVKKRTFTPILFSNENENVVCAIGKSRKLMKFLLNQLSSKEYIGGAVFGENTRMMPLIKQYSPSKSLLPIEEMKRYTDSQHKLTGKIHNCPDVRSKNWRNYIISLQYNERERMGYNRVLLMNSRHTFTDVFMYLDSFAPICPSERAQIDVYVLKKTKRESPIHFRQFMSRIFAVHEVDQISTMYDQTMKTDKVLIVHAGRDFRADLIDITKHLKYSYLSDHIFWHNVHLENNE